MTVGYTPFYGNARAGAAVQLPMQPVSLAKTAFAVGTMARDFSGPGYLGGEYPGGITTVEGAPVSAEIRILWRDPDSTALDGVVVARTTSSMTGAWKVMGLNPDLKYDVVGRKAGLNDVIASNIQPVRTDVIQITGGFTNNAGFNGADGSIQIHSGVAPFSCTVISPLPFGLIPVIDGRTLIIDGASDDDGNWESMVRIVDANGVGVDVPVSLLIGLSLPVVTARYAVDADWQITLDFSTSSVFASGFEIYRDTTPIDPSALPAPIAVLPISASTFVDESVTPGETYYYRVCAVSGSNKGFSDNVIRAALWSPADLKVAPKIWMDHESDVIEVSGRVSSWANKGSVGGAFTQPSSANRPEKIPVAAGGKSALKFNNACLENNTAEMKNVLRNSAYASLFAVYRRTNSGTSYSAQPLVVFSTGISSVGRFAAYAGTGGSSANNNFPGIGVRQRDNESSISGNYNSVSTGTEFVMASFIANYLGGKTAVSVNAGAPFEKTLVRNERTENTMSTFPVKVGQEASSDAQKLYGEISAIVLHEGDAMNEIDQKRLEGWGAHTYGLVADLPTGHPYKVTAP